jgi:hypothetical protein
VTPPAYQFLAIYEIVSIKRLAGGIKTTQPHTETSKRSRGAAAGKQRASGRDDSEESEDEEWLPVATKKGVAWLCFLGWMDAGLGVCECTHPVVHKRGACPWDWRPSNSLVGHPSSILVGGVGHRHVGETSRDRFRIDPNARTRALSNGRAAQAERNRGCRTRVSQRALVVFLKKRASVTTTLVVMNVFLSPPVTPF